MATQEFVCKFFPFANSTTLIQITNIYQAYTKNRDWLCQVQIFLLVALPDMRLLGGLWVKSSNQRAKFCRLLGAAVHYRRLALLGLGSVGSYPPGQWVGKKQMARFTKWGRLGCRHAETH